MRKTGAAIKNTITSTGNKIVTGCWKAPNSPTLLSPTDNAATNSASLAAGWQATTSSCPTANISYRFRIFSDSGLTTLVEESGWQTTTSFNLTNLTENEYWWLVQARDQYLNTTNSTTYSFIIDKTAPTVVLSASASPTKTVEERISDGGWQTVGDVEIVEGEARIGNSEYSNDEGNYYYENKLVTTLTGGFSSLSFKYKFVTTDTEPSDDPGFLVRINGTTILQRSAKDGNSEWQAFYLNLSELTDERINIAFLAGNTDDKLLQSWVYLDKITTNIAAATESASFTLTGEDSGTGIDYYEYSIDDGSFTKGDTFSISEAGNYVIKYRAIDRAGNTSDTKETTAVINGSVAKWSDLATDTVVAKGAGEAANYGDIIINELLWMGTAVSTADEYLELRNRTDQELSLQGMYFTKFNGTDEVAMDVDLGSATIGAGGYFLIGNKKEGYTKGNSMLAVEADIWDTSLELSNSNLQIRLYNQDGELVDVAGDGGEPFEGLHNISEKKYYSMQRAPIPDDGSEPINWFTAFDPNTTESYFNIIGGAATRGTPDTKNY